MGRRARGRALYLFQQTYEGEQMPTNYKPPEMSPRLKRLIKDGNDGTYKSDFGYEWAIALAAVNAGHSEAYLRKLLIDVGPLYHEIETKRGKGRADRYVTRLYEKAVRYREERPPWRSRADVAAYLAAAAEWLQALPIWKGRTGNRNLTVLLAIVELAAQVGSTVLSFSTRQLADKIKPSRKSVEKAIHDLKADGWLKLEEPTRGVLAPRYRLLLAENERSYPTSISLDLYRYSWG
jgi:biotin operon repressor